MDAKAPAKALPTKYADAPQKAQSQDLLNVGLGDTYNGIRIKLRVFIIDGDNATIHLEDVERNAYQAETDLVTAEQYAGPYDLFFKDDAFYTIVKYQSGELSAAYYPVPTPELEGDTEFEGVGGFGRGFSFTHEGTDYHVQDRSFWLSAADTYVVVVRATDGSTFWEEGDEQQILGYASLSDFYLTPTSTSICYGSFSWPEGYRKAFGSITLPLK
jgi:hypothetical protein